jgi:hypothetical protein
MEERLAAPAQLCGRFTNRFIREPVEPWRVTMRRVGIGGDWQQAKLRGRRVLL